MTDERVWREGATEAELERVARLDQEIASLAVERAALTYERGLITNRACQRERYRRRVKIPVDSHVR
jgi:hypothetical protein